MNSLFALRISNGQNLKKTKDIKSYLYNIFYSNPLIFCFSRSVYFMAKIKKLLGEVSLLDSADFSLDNSVSGLLESHQLVSIKIT
jgi:hypothetical protein